MSSILFETERLVFRDWVHEDWLKFRELATNPLVLKYIGDGKPWPDERIKRFVDGGIEMAKTRGWILWPVILKKSSELVGMCGFNSAFAPEVEIGWWLLPDYWGRGLATEAARAALEYGFAKFKFSRVISVAQPANVASIRIMEKLGMTPDRRFVYEGVDVVNYAISKTNVGGSES